MKNGREVAYREARRDDEEAIALMLSSLAEESLYSRYIGYRRPAKEEIRANLEGGGVREIILVALPVGSENEIVAQVGCVFLDPPTSAELSMIVRDDWQNQGLGTALLKAMLSCASQAGVERIVGVIGLSNDRMIHVLDKLGFTTHTRHYDHLEMSLEISSQKKRTFDGGRGGSHTRDRNPDQCRDHQRGTIP